MFSVFRMGSKASGRGLCDIERLRFNRKSIIQKHEILPIHDSWTMNLLNKAYQ